jgi:hypothetical protein
VTTSTPRVTRRIIRHDGHSEGNVSMSASSTKRPLKIGLFFPHAQVGADGRVPHWSTILSLARHAEQAGFDSIWFPDHLFHVRGELGLERFP